MVVLCMWLKMCVCVCVCVKSHTLVCTHILRGGGGGGGASTYLFMCSPSLCIRFLVAGELVTVVYEGFRMEVNLWKGRGGGGGGIMLRNS